MLLWSAILECPSSVSTQNISTLMNHFLAIISKDDLSCKQQIFVIGRISRGIARKGQAKKASTVTITHPACECSRSGVRSLQRVVLPLAWQRLDRNQPSSFCVRRLPSVLCPDYFQRDETLSASLMCSCRLLWSSNSSAWGLSFDTVIKVTYGPKWPAVPLTPLVIRIV